MKKTILFFYCLFLLVPNVVLAQNWNVFNKDYRYNYKYNHSQLISQVLFVDSVKLMGTDTVYAMNRVGVECSGTCPGLSVAPTTTETVIVPNMPQFLQRKIIKSSNGLVRLHDTSKLVINPMCQPGQSWLFDSINNKMAFCLNKTGQVLFGVADSVKNIILGGTDTLKLSKKFGIIQFPNLYNKNKYYRLTGIEKASTYDSTALYGEKVPNAWDFYNFNAGDRFCYKERLEYTAFLQRYWWCTVGNFTIKSKAITGDTYSYSVEQAWDTCATNFVSANGKSPGTSSARSYTNLSSSRLENLMYPGQIIRNSYYGNAACNIVKFGKNLAGTFFKYAGISCSDLVLSPAAEQGFGFDLTSKGYLTPVYKIVAEVYGVGLGDVDRALWEPGTQNEYCQTCAVKAGTLYHGTETFVGIGELEKTKDGIQLYPNPFKDKLNLKLGSIPVDELKISNLLGQTILLLHKNFQGEQIELDLGTEKSGIYMIQLFNKGHLVNSQKLIKN